MYFRSGKSNINSGSGLQDPALPFENSISEDYGAQFNYNQGLGDPDNPSLMFRNNLVEENERFNQQQHERHARFTAQIKDESLHASDRSKTQMLSNFGNFRDQVSSRSTRSPVAYFIRDWWLELIACLFLLAALVAIIIIAQAYQDHPLPNLPKGISINSILAIFNVISKAAMLLVLAQGLSHLKWTWFGQSRPLDDLAVYDNASRGPLGSVWLIFRSRGRDWVSSIGALLTIAAVVLDPMAQQVIRYYTCPKILPDVTAAIPRTNAYMEIGAHAFAGINSVPQPLQAAINGGVFVPGAQVSFNCLTGNCTFPALTKTIGMRSVCSDVSDELVFANISVETFTTLNATLPSGLSTSYNPYYANVTLMTMGYNLSTSSFEVILGPRMSNPGTDRNFCANSSYPDEPLGPSPSWNCRGWGAARCQLSPVVYTVFNASIQSGRLQENLTYEVSFDAESAGLSGNSLGVVDLSCLSASQISQLQDAGYTIPSSSKWLAYNVSVDYYGNFVSSNPNVTNSTLEIVPKECIYQVYGTSFNSINYFLSDYLSGSIVPFGARYTGSTVAQQFFNNYAISFGSIDSMLNNITSSMTTYIRQNGLVNNSAPLLGEVWDADTCIRVRWAYVAFPASLTGLTVLFFAAMVVATKHAQQGLHHDFKSSPLALLFHGFDENTTRKVETSRYTASNKVGDLTEEAKNMFVQLKPTEKGWRLVADDEK